MSYQKMLNYMLMCMMYSCQMGNNTTRVKFIHSIDTAAASTQGVKVIAHRGDSAKFPENTLPAFSSAAQMGADFIEMDVRVSQDGQMFLMHDGTLDRTTNADEVTQQHGLSVKKAASEFIEQLDAGSWKSDVFSGVGVPTLQQSLTDIEGKSNILLDHKTGDAKEIVQVIQNLGVQDRVYVQDADLDFLNAIADADSSVERVALCRGDQIDEDMLAALIASNIRYVNWEYSGLNADIVKKLRDHNIMVWAYTVDDMRKIRELIEAGVQGITTNHPERTLNLLAYMF